VVLQKPPSILWLALHILFSMQLVQFFIALSCIQQHNHKSNDKSFWGHWK